MTDPPLGRNDAFSVVGGAPTARFVDAKVSRVSGSQVFVISATFDAGLEFGPCTYAGSAPAVGTPVLVAVMTGTTEAWIVAANMPAGGSTPVGAVFDFPGPVTPALHLDCYGQSVLRASYLALYGALVKPLGVFSVTIASPGVFTRVAHGLVVGDPVFLETKGALPTGLAADTTYYVMTRPTADTFTLGTTRTVNTITGVVSVTTAKNTSGTQSGAHSLFYAPYEVADSTHFYVPDYRGMTGIALDNLGGTDAGRIAWSNVLGIRAGEGTHTMLTGEAAQKVVDSDGASNTHTHALDVATATGGSAGNYTVPSNLTPSGGQAHTGPDEVDHHHHIQGSDAATGHNTMQPSVAVKKIIYAGA